MGEGFEWKTDQIVAKNLGNDKVYFGIGTVLRTWKGVLHENYRAKCVDALRFHFESQNRYQDD